MTEAQERLLFEAVAANTNSMNLLTRQLLALEESIQTIEWRQETEVGRWREHWKRFTSGDAYTAFSGQSSSTPKTVDLG
jgi:hypothetical protein